jgi:two-component system cell cycle response regulator
MRRNMAIVIMPNIGNHPPLGSFQDVRQAELPVTTAKTKILVVDDEMAVALMMVFLLTRAGCEAQTASSVEKALRLAQTEAFDLITLDVDMPVSGFELFQLLKKIPHLRETPVVFVSGNATIENQQRGLDLGAADFIEKPFDSSDFVSRILSLVEESTTA